ncbi:MAG TPA: hypothetical protein VEU08_14540, partial [Vicinamibacterales bacterium]|nr:hypothetical protein [Vicinamibacterales bacterium]
GILTETAHASATPATYDPKAFPKFFAGTTVPTLEPTTFYPSPYLGGEWHLRDSCNIMVTTSMAVLDIAAKRRQEFLYDIYQMGRDAVRNNVNETFIVPAQQWDPPTAVKMINVLQLGGVEVERATAAFSVGEKKYDAGSFVIRGAQPFEPYVRDLLTPQVYPDMRLYPGGPPKRPYDITGWTLNYQMGVTVDRVMQRVDVSTEKVDVAQPPHATMPAGVAGQPYYFAIDTRANDAFIAVNRLLSDRVRVFRAADGTFLVPPDARPDSRKILPLGVSLTVGPTSLPAGAVEIHAPRVGLYHAWGGNMDEGWTRWILEQFEFPYTSVFDRDIRAGSLHAKFDVILLPDATYDSMLKGMAPGSMPDAYTGGMTARGVANLLQFVKEGGTLVAMDRAAELPIAAFNLPIRNVTDGLSPNDFYIPGSILKITVDRSNPIAYGMPADAAAFFINSPAFAVDGNPPNVKTVAQYPNSDVLMSGWMLGEHTIAGRAAVVEATIDQGRVVLLGFRTQHRGQMHGGYKLLFNSILSAAQGR